MERHKIEMNLDFSTTRRGVRLKVHTAGDIFICIADRGPGAWAPADRTANSFNWDFTIRDPVPRKILKSF